MLELDRVTAHYGKNPVLRAVSMTLRAGEIVTLIGANAAGKSTTLRAIMGLKSLTSGAIRFNDIDRTKSSIGERLRSGLVLVPEGRQIFPKFTVHENLLMGAFLRSDRSQLEVDLESVFEMFPRLAERRSQRAGSMSGGEQQMLAIARGLIQQPKCLLLDEPTLGLAPIIVDEIVTTIRALGKRGLSVLIAEQNAAVALGVADRAYVIESGAVISEGRAADLAADDVVRRNYLGV